VLLRCAEHETAPEGFKATIAKALDWLGMAPRSGMAGTLGQNEIAGKVIDKIDTPTRPHDRAIVSPSPVTPSRGLIGSPCGHC
jgi:hypothetical protein